MRKASRVGVGVEVGTEVGTKMCKKVYFIEIPYTIPRSLWSIAWGCLGYVSELWGGMLEG